MVNGITGVFQFMITISVRGLARSTTENSLTDLFTKFGKVHSVKLVKDLFTGQCKGFGEVKMEGHEARNAIAALNFKDIDGSTIRVDVDNGRGKSGKRRR
jgi:RNA recognition motif-containing protein